jgi:RNA 2',3'-cyclic 3'-phosphodiesterase
MKRRLFVAADLDEASRSACAAVAERLRARGWPGAWVAPANYHLTVAFLGSAAEERLADVSAAMRALAPRLRSLDIPLDAVGAFPNDRKPRVAWVGPAVPVPAFGALCGLVRAALEQLGFHFEDRAEPHVTLARSAGSTPLPRIEPPHAGAVHVDTLTVFQSLTEPAGARYDRLERVAFGAGGNAKSPLDHC